MKSPSKGKFYIQRKKKNYVGVIENFDAGKCKVLALGEIDVCTNKNAVKLLCDRKLPITKNVILNIPMAFPIRKEIAAEILHLFKVY